MASDRQTSEEQYARATNAASAEEIKAAQGTGTQTPSPPATSAEGIEEEGTEGKGAAAEKVAKALQGAAKAFGGGQGEGYAPATALSGGAAKGGAVAMPSPIPVSPAMEAYEAFQARAAADLMAKTRAFESSPGNQIAIRTGMATYKDR